jgi:hypothetical protein
VVAAGAGRSLVVDVDGERASGVGAVGAGVAGGVAAHRGDQADLVFGAASQQVRSAKGQGHKVRDRPALSRPAGLR